MEELIEKYEKIRKQKHEEIDADFDAKIEHIKKKTTLGDHKIDETKLEIGEGLISSESPMKVKKFKSKAQEIVETTDLSDLYGKNTI